jgi:very-short-patch-repair endonuclease
MAAPHTLLPLGEGGPQGRMRAALARRYAMPDNRQKGRSRALRRNMTDAEMRLWKLLRDRRLMGAKFRRQVPVGPYIVNFYCHDSRLVVEADGGQHLDSHHDAVRTAFLEQRGLKVVRFWNDQILKESSSVMEQILTLTSTLPPSPAAARRPARISRCPERWVRKCAQERPRPHPRYATPWRGRPPEGEANSKNPPTFLRDGQATTTEETGS